MTLYCELFPNRNQTCLGRRCPIHSAIVNNGTISTPRYLYFSTTGYSNILIDSSPIRTLPRSSCEISSAYSAISNRLPYFTYKKPIRYYLAITYRPFCARNNLLKSLKNLSDIVISPSFWNSSALSTISNPALKSTKKTNLFGSLSPFSFYNV